jgi:hypothetical protein
VQPAPQPSPPATAPSPEALALEVAEPSLPEIEAPAPLAPSMATPPRPEPTPPAPWTAEAFPSAARVLQAGAGFLLLGLAGAAGKGTVEAAVLLPGVILGLAVLPGLIGVPALMVLHQHQRLAASPAKLLQALAEAWMESGRLAGGLASVVLFFALTSLMGTELLFYGLALAGWLGLAAARRRLREVEHAAGGNPRSLGGLLAAWTLLTTLIGARLTWMAIHWLQELGA